MKTVKNSFVAVVCVLSFSVVAPGLAGAAGISDLEQAQRAYASAENAAALDARTDPSERDRRRDAARALKAPGTPASLTDGTADCRDGTIDGADIDNSTIRIGARCHGAMNIEFPGDPEGIDWLGLRYIPTGGASTEPGCAAAR